MQPALRSVEAAGFFCAKADKKKKKNPRDHRLAPPFSAPADTPARQCWVSLQLRQRRWAKEKGWGGGARAEADGEEREIRLLGL